MDFQLTSNEIASYFDPVARVWRIFVGDYPNDRIVRHDVDSLLNHTQTPLPLPYGVTWLASDLDRDGEIELVVQRGDPGFGGDGYLDILSAPGWTLRRRITFPGMKVGMTPAIVDVDVDPFRELYITPGDLNYNAYPAIVKYISATNTFEIVSQIAAPPGTGDRSAIGDFDSDGRVEFITGGVYGYGLFEWKDAALVYVGLLWDTTYENSHHAVACRPKPDGQLYGLVGYSEVVQGFRYKLVRATSDNTFEVSHEFQEITGAAGGHSSFGLDTDCDGLDELVMQFYPYEKMWEWDRATEQFQLRCTWSSDTYGTQVEWWGLDLTRDGMPEWGAINHLNHFLAFSDPGCVGCDSTGHCPLVDSTCECDCHGDPKCDGIRCDVLDVVATVQVAFRSGSGVTIETCPSRRTDVDCNNLTDVIDVVAVVDVAFRGSDPDVEFCNPCSTATGVAMTSALVH